MYGSIKITTRWLMVLVILYSITCSRFQRPGNVIFLTSLENKTLYCPVWGSNDKMYFLASDFEMGEGELYAEVLWEYNSIDSSYHKLLEGRFGYLTISHDGSKLAMTGGKLYDQRFVFDGGPLMLMHLNDTVTVDTIATTEVIIASAKFSFDDNRIYFYAYDYDYGTDTNGIYRIDLDGSNEEFLQESNDVFFDLTPGNVIINNLNGTKNICPTDSNSIIISSIPIDGFEKCGLGLYDNNSQQYSELNAKPYESCCVCFPSWSPQGKKIVYTVAEEKSGEYQLGYGELWILDLIAED
ncbi:MAG: hypothetical protein WBB37_06535 [bacterium]